MPELETAETAQPISKSADGARSSTAREATSPLPSPSLSRFWLIFAAIALAVLMAAALRWSFAHPYGVHWDEAEYFNDVQIDVHRLQSGMLLRFCGRLLLKTWGRPPAFRLLSDPVLALIGFHTFSARLVSLALFGFSVWFVYLAVKRIASQAAAALAALIFALSPEVVSASIFFGTDTSLYLATSAMLYFLIALWSEESAKPANWIGLGLALGLGFLAKTSFIVVALPVLAFWFVAARWGQRKLPSPASQWKAGVLAFVVAGPWWIINARAAFAYGHYARTFVRNSLGTPSLVTGALWLNSAVQCLLGHGISVLIALLLIAIVVAIIRGKQILDPLQKTVLGACACAGLPIICAQLSGTNHLLRHVSPAMIPLAITVGILFESVGWDRSRAMTAVASVLLCVQLGMLIAPVISPNTEPVELGFVNGALPWRTIVRFDQWDWTPVRAIADDCGLQDPKISYLGNGRAFNKPQIEYPWVVRSASVKGAAVDLPDPTWLWRYENGPIGWPGLMDTAEQSDIVLTAPHFVGEAAYGEDRDNRYNADFAARLSQDQRFREATVVKMGRFEPVELLVFVNKNLVCQSDNGLPLQP
jgi:4-amino-4-deoxy-L-arabinose transferase-like glycosyltransferase